MPRVIPTAETETIELGHLVELLEAGRFDPEDEDCFASFGPALRKLANNRAFLTDMVVEELKHRCHNQTRDNQYSPQVIMLHGRGRNFAIRANFWPALDDSVIQSSGTAPFFYGVPHDHNFSFLTVGYLGPGYWSDYYEYDHEAVAGYTGEPVNLRFVEKSRLEPGKVMLYRAHRDVHNQLPADEMSVSINIMHASPCLPFLSQYRFDVAQKRIAGILSRTSAEALLALAAHHGGDNGRDLLEGFAADHPCDRIQFAALRALASADDDVDAQVERLGRGRHSANAFVAAMSARDSERLAAHRGWIER